MSKSKADQPKRLAEKLKQIRCDLGLTQQQLFEDIKAEMKGCAKLHFGYLSRYEAGSRVPSLLVLLAYSRVSGISLETIIDDNLFLPKKLSAKKK